MLPRRRPIRNLAAAPAGPKLCPRADMLASLPQATHAAGAVFTVLTGAILFGYFLTVTRTPQRVTGFITGLGLGPLGLLALIMLMYLVSGCLMDAMAMVILTVPIIFPAVTAPGFDPIWFGVIIVMTVELGLIRPPTGMNVCLIKTAAQDVSFTTIFDGMIPFVVTDILRLAILIAFRVIATWLPRRMWHPAPAKTIQPASMDLRLIASRHSVEAMAAGGPEGRCHGPCRGSG